MRYLLLIYQSEAEHAKYTQEQLGAEYTAYMAYGEEVQKKGLFVSGTGCANPPDAGWIVHSRDSQRLSGPTSNNGTTSGTR